MVYSEELSGLQLGNGSSKLFQDSTSFSISSSVKRQSFKAEIITPLGRSCPI